jgi:glycosyltransferase involved in cell wall biosynthesis
MAMLLGGFHDLTRASDVAAGRRPANDVHVLVDAFSADVLDFAWLESHGAASLPGRIVRDVARRLGGWSAALAVSSAVRVRHYDVVYVSGEDVGVVACAISRVLPGRRPQFVVRVEQPLYGRTKLRRRVHRALFRFASARMDVVLCRTAAHAAYVRRTTRIAPDRVIAFGQEIDTAFFDEDRPDASGTAPVALPVDGPFVLSAGLERRDYATLLDAVDAMPVSLVIAAGSPWSKDTFDVARDLPCNVVVGSFDARTMRELYRAARLVVLSVHPTERACGMNVVGEAWAMRRPVIATATAGLREFVRHGDNGILTPPGDPRALRAAIEHVLGDEATARRVADGGRSTARGSLSLDHFRATVARAVSPLAQPHGLP